MLLSILYDTGARIQELLDLTPRDFHLESPPFVCVRGKGRRERLSPLLPQSARLVRQFLCAEGRQLNEQQPFLQNGRGGRLGRHGARYILLKYLRRATPAMPTLARVGISPHTMRHTKAMHLLQSGVPLVMVKDFVERTLGTQSQRECLRQRPWPKCRSQKKPLKIARFLNTLRKPRVSSSLAPCSTGIENGQRVSMVPSKPKIAELALFVQNSTSPENQKSVHKNA